MSRCVVKTEDGRYMYNYSIWYTWGPDLQKARIFRGRGDAELSCRHVIETYQRRGEWIDGTKLSIRNIRIEEA